MASVSTLAGAAAAGGAESQTGEASAVSDRPFKYALNTSTLQGFKLPIDEELKLIAKVGYQGVEPWIRQLEAYRDSGGALTDLAKFASDHDLAIPSAIGFFDWVVDDDKQRAAGFENARRAMELVRAIGGTHIAAPPVGATETEGIDLRELAERYAKLLAIGRDIGVLPEVEVWGFSKTLGNLADASFVAIACGQPDATILPDVYHMYKGGSAHRGLRMLNGRAMPAIHLNDYPAEPDRAAITDAHRVFPGDGVAPLGEILGDLRDIGFEGYLSLELFNRDYWKLDPETVARTGLRKMQAAVSAALAK
jgi:sugar phosphate isomerase/epimerase